MNNKIDGAGELYPCTHCAGGVRSLRHITYFTWLKNQLITVPNFPAWVCDVCGRRDYDMRAVSWLNTMLQTPRTKRRIPHRTSPLPPQEPPPV